MPTNPSGRSNQYQLAISSRQPEELPDQDPTHQPQTSPELRHWLLQLSPTVSRLRRWRIADLPDRKPGEHAPPEPRSADRGTEAEVFCQAVEPAVSELRTERQAQRYLQVAIQGRPGHTLESKGIKDADKQEHQVHTEGLDQS